MKNKLFLTLLSVFLSITYSHAQLSKTIDVTTPGTLSLSLGDDKTKVSELTLTGTINDADFTTIKQMSLLKVLDMSTVNIVNGAIPASAFENRVMDRIVLPEDIKTIGDNCFKNTTLTSPLIFPSSVESLGNGALYQIRSSFDLSKTKGSLAYIGQYAFGNISAATLDFSDFSKLSSFGINGSSNPFKEYRGHVILPLHLISLPNCLFESFTGSVTLHEGIKTIGDNCFKNTTLTSPLIFPSSVESLGNGALYQIKSSFDLSKTKGSLAYIGQYTFGNISVETLNFSDFTKLSSFGINGVNNPFKEYRGHVILPLHLISLPNCLFESFTGSVTLHEGIKTIGDNCFKNTTLTSPLIFPSSVESLGNGALYQIKSSFDLSKTKGSLAYIGQYTFGNISVETLNFS
ncbi:leucine rich repeat (LRR) protein, partial [Dysgonomonas alginatilytica]